MKSSLAKRTKNSQEVFRAAAAVTKSPSAAVVVLLLFLVLSSSRSSATAPQPLQTSADGCSQFSSCIDCTAVGPGGNCGWCTSSASPSASNGGSGGDGGTCKLGTQAGPSTNGGTCPSGGSWLWDVSQCEASPQPTLQPANCGQFTDCGTCTTQAAQGNCGWCTAGSATKATAGTCLQGTDSGPLSNGGTCPNNGDWQWTDSTCGGTPAPPVPGGIGCSGYGGGCTVCTGSPSGACGWCASDKVCSEGGDRGPYSGTCRSGDWHWFEDKCPVPIPATPAPPVYLCNQYSSQGCSACTGSPSGHCGWCSTTNTCSKGTFNGPDKGTCSPGWRWYSLQCTVTTTAAPAPPLDDATTTYK